MSDDFKKFSRKKSPSPDSRIIVGIIRNVLAKLLKYPLRDRNVTKIAMATLIAQ